jgi:4'-phosphopantetheinyl transferase
MTRNDSDWVNGLFVASARDWTPAAVHRAAYVLYAPVSRDPEASKRCASVLSDTELERAERFVTQDLKAHFKQRRAFRRYCGAVALGSPRPLTHGIGVDFEDKTRNVEPAELAQRFYSEAEAKVVEAVGGLARLRTFFQLWCLKEAALKSIGEGLPIGLDAFEFELTPNLRVVHAPRDHGGPRRFDVHLIEGTDSCAALVIRTVT